MIHGGTASAFDSVSARGNTTAMDNKIEVDGEWVLIQDLIDEISTLRDFRDSTRVMLEREDSVLKVLTASIMVWTQIGWDRRRIDQASSDLLRELNSSSDGQDDEDDEESDDQGND